MNTEKPKAVENTEAKPGCAPVIGSAAVERPKPTIEELERILASGEKPAIEIQPDGSIKAIPQAGKMTAILDAAVELCAFCRTNGYPAEGTPNFFKLTELVDRLDTTLRREHLIAQVLTPTHY